MTNQQNTNGAAMTIKLGNEDFNLRREIRNVSDLKLDPANQRISFKLKKQKVIATDSDLHKILWEMDSVKELYNSIRQNGGLIEDPIVRTDNYVVEGNCRTVALRELHKKFPDDARFTQLYVRVLPAGVTEEQLTLLLGELHIAGKIAWKAYEQAEYVWKMNNLYGKSYDFLANHLRIGKSKLQQKILAYEETNNYIKYSGDDKAIDRFSHFEEFMKKKELRDERERDPHFMARFFEWVRNGQLPDSRDTRFLPEILKNKEAYDKFLKHGISEAKLVLFKSNPSLESNLYNTIDLASSELETIPLVEIEALRDGDTAKIEKLERLKRALQKIDNYVSVTIK